MRDDWKYFLVIRVKHNIIRDEEIDVQQPAINHNKFVPFVIFTRDHLQPRPQGRDEAFNLIVFLSLLVSLE